jgi:hypothetical protein
VSEFSSIIGKIKCILSIRNDFEVKSIRRQTNIVAHTLAKADVSWPIRHTFNLIPPGIESLIYNEMK